MKEILPACEGLPERRFCAGEVLLREGDDGVALFVLIEGDVSVCKGTVEVARAREPGALFGEMSALLGQPYSASVVARGDVRTFEVPDGRAFLAEHPAVALHTARLLAQRLHDATTYLADLKAQFGDRSDHFGMVDRILDALLQSQLAKGAGSEERSDDPRL